VPRLKISTYTLFFLIIYLLVIFFLFNDVNKYGYFVHGISLGIFTWTTIKLLKRNSLTERELLFLKKYFFAATIISLLLFLTCPLVDILKFLYLLLIYFCLWYNFKDKKIKTDIYFYWILISTSFSFLLNKAGINPPIDARYSPFKIIPSVKTGLKLNIGPPGSNIHFTALISGLALILSFNSLLNLGWNLRRLIAVLIATYFCFFAGSRAVYLGVFASILAMTIDYIFHKKENIYQNVFAFSSWGILIVSLFIVYSSDTIILAFKNSFTNNLVTSFTKADLQDPSAGRSALWNLHASIFAQHPFGGGGEELRNFNVQHENELVNNIYRATSESYFTFLFAVYGLWSIFIFYLYGSLFFNFSMSKDVLKTSLLLFALVTTAASSLFGNSYGMGVWLVVPLLSAKLDPS